MAAGAYHVDTILFTQCREREQPLRRWSAFAGCACHQQGNNDLLILSQHTHIPTNLSQGEKVPPFPALEQEVFTRSLVMPSWLSKMLLHIDAHELHHMYPFVPGYRLRDIPYDTRNEIDWRVWVKGARAVQGETLMFHNLTETGVNI